MKYRPPRLTCAFPVRVHLPGRSVRGVIRDVHGAGAKLTGLGEVTKGDGCTLVIDGVRMPATIRWCDGDAVGVAFQRRLSERQVAIVGRTAAPAAAPEAVPVSIAS